MANQALADMAIFGVEKADWAPLEKQWCQKEQRLVIQHVYGDKFNAYMKASANLTGRAFQAAGLAMTAAQAGELQIGDIVYKCPDDLKAYGHVGTFVGVKGIAENSSTSIGRVREALGYRSVAQFGHYDLVVRLPAPVAAKPEKPASLVIGVTDGKDIKYTRLQSAVLKNGSFSADTAELAKVLLGETQPVRATLDQFGYSIQSEGDYLTDDTDPRQYVIVQKAAS
jgi:hypothetical protein